MRIETLLNKVYRHKLFVYKDVKIKRIGRRAAIVVDIEPRKNGLALCSARYTRQRECRRGSRPVTKGV